MINVLETQLKEKQMELEIFKKYFNIELDPEAKEIYDGLVEDLENILRELKLIR